MFQYQNLFRIITLPLSLSNQPNNTQEKQFLLKTTSNFRNTVHEKPSQHGEKQRGKAEPNRQKEKEKANEMFENNFKRKYYSVCSQMIKIKNEWKQQKENREGDINISGSKFYERMGSTLLKGLEEANRNKTKSKWNRPRQSFKGKSSLKLNIQQPGDRNLKSTLFKRQNCSYKELMLEKELTLQKRQSVCKRSKVHSNCSIQQSNPLEITDLKGWNHLEQIIEDDLYESH